MATQAQKDKAAQRARDRRAAQRAKPMTTETKETAAETAPVAQETAAPVQETPKAETEPTKPVSTPKPASKAPSLPPFEEVQPGVRWVRATAIPYLRHEEVISFAEDSGYDNNGSMRVQAVIDRALVKLFVGGDRSAHVFDPRKMPPFDPQVRIRVLVEVLDADTPHE